MNSLVAAKAGSVEQVPADLSGKLQWLCRFGRPHMYRSDGWSANIDMNTNTTGSEFKVWSDFGHPTPDDAIDALIANMLQALKALTGGSDG